TGTGPNLPQRGGLDDSGPEPVPFLRKCPKRKKVTLWQDEMVLSLSPCHLIIFSPCDLGFVKKTGSLLLRGGLAARPPPPLRGGRLLVRRLGLVLQRQRHHAHTLHLHLRLLQSCCVGQPGNRAA